LITATFLQCGNGSSAVERPKKMSWNFNFVRFEGVDTRFFLTWRPKFVQYGEKTIFALKRSFILTV
jgi:hypothetical protein